MEEDVEEEFATVLEEEFDRLYDALDEVPVDGEVEDEGASEEVDDVYPIERDNWCLGGLKGPFNVSTTRMYYGSLFNSHLFLRKKKNNKRDKWPQLLKKMKRNAVWLGKKTSIIPDYPFLRRNFIEQSRRTSPHFDEEIPDEVDTVGDDVFGSDEEDTVMKEIVNELLAAREAVGLHEEERVTPPH